MPVARRTAAVPPAADNAGMHPDPWHDPRLFLRSLFDAAVDAAQPARVIPPKLPPPPRGRTVVLGAGKAAAAMAAAVEACWPAQAPLSGLVITRYGHVPPSCATAPRRIDVVEAAHPVPDEAGEQAARRLLAMTEGLTADDLVLCLISGGGSALMSVPAPGLSLADKQRIHQALLWSGADIREMNCVRKHLSAIKGGRLAVRCAPAQVVSLLISDVPGDDPSVIASGPTVADPSRCADALEILARYRIEVPAAVRTALEHGQLETPKPGDPRLAGHQVTRVATPWASLQAAAAVARAAGITPHVLGDEIEGESHVVGRVHAAMARAVAMHGQPFTRPCVLLSGGETTVTVHDGQACGRGGRATEFLLGCAASLRGLPGVWALAGDTDGIDGVESNAGAVIGPDTLARAAQHGLSTEDSLATHDAWTFFSTLGDLLITGPTYTNVNDFRAILIQ